MKDLVLLTVSPSSLRFAWENYIFLNNLREKNLSYKAEILIFVPQNKVKEGPHPLWSRLETDFPEAKFYHYYDRAEYQTSIARLGDIFGYVPILRPYCLGVHFKNNPSLSEKTIFYTDSDILLTKHFNFEPFLEDDVNYMSDAKTYTNSDYFQSKSQLEEDINSPIYNEPKFILPQKYEGFSKRNILNECAKICGITDKDVIAHKNKSGAAQYLLKNVDYAFWNNVFDACLELKMHLAGINQQYMRGETAQNREDNGFQSWCADIWAVTWNLIRRGRQIETPPEFDFAWATDLVSRLDSCAFLHNAGVTSDEKIKARIDDKKEEVECPAFFKGCAPFIDRDHPISPFDEEFQPVLDNIINNSTSQLFCTGLYAKEIKRTKQIYKL